MPEAFCGIEMCAKMLCYICEFCERKKYPSWKKKLPTTILQYSFSHRAHRRTEHTGFHRDIKSTDITEPYSQFLLKRSVFSVCRRSSVGSKCAPKGSVNSVRSVRDITPHCEYPTIFLSQKNTDEQNTQRPTETLSQPISQNVTPIFSSNALCSLYAEGLLWARNYAQ